MCGLGFSDISVVIPTNHKRVKELEAVLGHLKKLGFEDIILAEGKHRMLNRFDAMSHAKNNIIYTQDDDCIIHNIPELIASYNPLKIVANAKLERMAYYQHVCDGRIALIGYGAVFHRDLRGNMNDYLKMFKEDDLLYREADRVFTWVNDKELIIADKHIEDFPSSMEGISMDTDHFTSMYIMIDRLKQL